MWLATMRLCWQGQLVHPLSQQQTHSLVSRLEVEQIWTDWGQVNLWMVSKINILPELDLFSKNRSGSRRWTCLIPACYIFQQLRSHAAEAPTCFWWKGSLACAVYCEPSRWGGKHFGKIMKNPVAHSVWLLGNYIITHLVLWHLS